MLKGASQASQMVLPALLFFILVSVAVPKVAEWAADQRTFLNCYSDFYAGIRAPIGEYRRLRGGPPPTWADLRSLPAAGFLPSQPHCREAHKPLVWRPEGFLLGSDAVLLMCPSGSHGFLRRDALGVTESGVLVRIDSKTNIQNWPKR